MANLTYEEIVKKYEKEGYLSVPNQYNKTRENRCKICGWKNWEQVDGCLCSDCDYQYMQDNKNNRMIANLIDARSLSRVDWLVLRAIAKQKADGVVPCVTMEEYVDLCKAHAKQIREANQAKTSEQEKFEAIFYG